MLCTKTMLSYCLKGRKNTENTHSKVWRTKNSRIYFYQKVQCVIVIKSKFLKEQVARGLFSNLAGTKEQIFKYVILV